MEIGDIVILFDETTIYTIISDDDKLWELQKAKHKWPFCDLIFAQQHCTLFSKKQK